MSAAGQARAPGTHMFNSAPPSISLFRFCIARKRGTHHDYDPGQERYPRVLPPLLPPHAPRPAPERVRLARERVGLVHEQVEALAPLQDRVDVLDHDVFAKWSA